MPVFSPPRLVKTLIRSLAALPVLTVLAVGLADFAHNAVGHMRLVANARLAAEAGIR